MKRPIASCLYLTAGILLLAGCGTKPEAEVLDPVELSRIAARKRFEDLQKRGVLRVAVSTKGGKAAYLSQNGTFEGPEVETVRELARKKGWRIFLFAVRPEALASTVRNGRADLAIGGLEVDPIRRTLLTPVLEYSRDGKRFAFATWSSAEELKNSLEK